MGEMSKKTSLKQEMALRPNQETLIDGPLFLLRLEIQDVVYIAGFTLEPMNSFEIPSSHKHKHY